jgi:radical SAM-linked protein
VARLVVKFTKGNRTKYISHLDTMRTLHRAFRRAQLPISYSKGFNPHASISVAAPLSLGIETHAEYADVVIDGEMDIDYLVNALNIALPADMKIVSAIPINGKMPAAMAAVEFARYSISFDRVMDPALCNSIIDEIMKNDEILKMKRSKSGEKLVNIRPFLNSIEISDTAFENVKFDCMIKSGSNGSLNIDLVSELLKEYSKGELRGHANVTREEVYTLIDGKKIPLDKYFSRK